jgi:hypothetical protein
MVQSEDPEKMLEIMQKKAEVAEKYEQGMLTILASVTNKNDWVQFGDYMCVKSDAAEKVGKYFPIKYYDIKCQKESWEDEVGPAYRYTYSGNATLNNSTRYAIGTFSSRDKFFGKKGGEFRSIHDISESNIQMAAYHIFMGNAIKALLGIRKIPVDVWERIFGSLGRDTSNKTSAGFDSPKPAGKTTKKSAPKTATGDDKELQKKLSDKILDLIDKGYVVVMNDKREYVPFAVQIKTPEDVTKYAQKTCTILSSFYGEDDKFVEGKKSPRELTGKWLGSTYGKLEKLMEENALDGPF